MKSNSTRVRKRRRAASLGELAMALVVVSLALSAAAQLFVTTARQQRTQHRRFVALQEANNLLERAVAKPGDEPLEAAVSAAATEQFPDLRASVEYLTSDNPPGEVCIRVRVFSEDSPAETHAVLVGWKYASQP